MLRSRHVPLLALLLGFAAVPAIPAAEPPSIPLAADPPAPPAPPPVVPFKILGPSAPVADGYAELTLSVPAKDGDKVTWSVKPKPVKETPGTNTFIFSGKPGTTYAVKVRVLNFDTKRLDEDETDLTFAGPPTPPAPPKPQPTPQPGPQPGPGPQPAPGGKVAKFVVVEDTSKAGQFRGDILASPAVQAYYKAAGLSHLLISSNAEADPASPAAKWKQYAAGKDLPYLVTLDASGAVLSQGKAPTTPGEFVAAIGGQLAHEDGERAMGNIEPEGGLRLKWNLFGSAPNVPLIPRGQWKEVDLSNYLPPVHDQDGIRQCNCSASCTVVETARNVAGLPYVYLSAGDLYARINGGRDNGSMLEDALSELMTNGVATAATVPYLWDRRRPHADAQTLAERKLYRVVEAYLCPDFDAVASALQQGFVLDIGILWYPNFRPDRDGWLPTRGVGRPGGHAICVYGLVKRSDGTWGLRMRNSWGTGWGVGGNAIIPESLLGRGIGGFYAVRSVVMTPDTNFPSPKLSIRRAVPADLALAF